MINQGLPDLIVLRFCILDIHNAVYTSQSQYIQLIERAKELDVCALFLFSWHSIWKNTFGTIDEVRYNDNWDSLRFNLFRRYCKLFELANCFNAYETILSAS